MSGFGTGPYGLGPFGKAVLPPEEPKPKILHSSREINGVTRRYVLDSDGNFEGMDDIAQRVLLLVSYADTEFKFITDRDNETSRQRIEAALSVLTSGKTPAIRIEAIEFTNPSYGLLQKRITYTNLRTNTQQTVEL